MSREQLLKEIEKLDDSLMDLILEHWIRFGNLGTWQFWTNIAFFIIPLIIVLIYIDKKRIFQIAFYGYTFHVMIVYLDVFFTRFNYWSHPYHMIPYIPVSIPVDATLVPVLFMLTYQYSLNHHKNFYLVTLVSSLFISLVAWIWKMLDLLELYKGMNFFHIFLLDVVMAILAYWFTAFFLKLRRE
ncbi:hypothetical protein GH741_11175 [Aquibacillus halophilus]|uniref:Uncharacterized protein n=1 Tax=Aquibacillus halophilus TaxID=930132 RepID=A0A6A8DHP8_9BACI|nr:CBO0543 family protein [Aquibacillus halophilus]MRH43241.1 hypothetical protein [Aquibacillus halophilus]